MKRYSFEVFADARPIIIPNPVVDASNHGVALSRAYRHSKKFIKHGAKTVTIRATRLGQVSSDTIP